MLRADSRSKSFLSRWMKRVFSTSQQQKLPLSVLEQLAIAPVQVHKFPGQGRGLVAARDIQYGEMVLTERPFVCCPSISNRKKVCYHCLKVLPSPEQVEQTTPEAAEQPVRGRNHSFCSSSCFSEAQASYYSLEQQLPLLQQLDAYCQQNAERFPLMATRLALTTAQDSMSNPSAAAAAAAAAVEPAAKPQGDVSRISHISRMSRSSIGSSSIARNSSLGSSSWLSSTGSSKSGAGDGQGAAHSSAGSALAHVNAALGFLCFANVPPPPPAPWETAHSLLLGALESAVGMQEQQEEADGLAAAVEQLDLDWYVQVMSRLHINTFKVDGVVGIDWSSGHAAAAAMLGGDSSTGSALYLTASLFNHSCSPNLNITFPKNDSTAVFTAARPIAAGEQLFISYIDQEQDVSTRQDYLAFAYGFRCGCSRCKEELLEADKHMPPRLP